METEQDLFAEKLNTKHPANKPGKDTRIELAAHRLAAEFTDEEELPARLRKNSVKNPKVDAATNRKPKPDSEREVQFRKSVALWAELMEQLLAKIDSLQAWRYINLVPVVESKAQRPADCKDFLEFMDYFILRRDKEKCSPEEVGGLAILSTALERAIEASIEHRESRNP